MIPAPIQSDLFQNLPQTTSSHYSHEALEQLKQNQYSKKVMVESILLDNKQENESKKEEQVIPNAKKIFEAKKLRELKRSLPPSDKSEEMDIIPLETNTKKESRLVCEDQEIEGMDVFEDDASSRLLFGEQAVKSAEQKKKVTFAENLLQAYVFLFIFIVL